MYILTRKNPTKTEAEFGDCKIRTTTDTNYEHLRSLKSEEK